MKGANWLDFSKWCESAGEKVIYCKRTIDKTVVIDLLRDKIAQVVDSMEDEIVDLTCKLIKFSTINDDGRNYIECTNFIYEKLKESGLEVQKIDVPMEKLESLWGKNLEKSLEYIPVGKLSPRVIVLGKWIGTPGKPSLHLNNHYDQYITWDETVKGNPYVPTVKEGKIFGKGASDPWAGTTPMIMAVEALRRAGVKLRGTLFVSATPDNHLGGESGAGYLVDEDYGKSDMVILGHPSGADTLTLGYKGALWIEITTFGKAVHGSEPHEGINAIEKMMKIQKALYELDQRFKNMRSKWPISPPESGRPTIVMANINATGLSVPDKCVMHIDVRVTPEQTMESVKEEILTEISKLEKEDKDLKVEVRTIHAAENPVTPADSPLAKTIMKNIREIEGVEPKTRVFAYYTDSRFFAVKWKAQTVNYSPGLPVVYRSSGEYVSVQDLVSATKVLALTIMDILG